MKGVLMEDEPLYALTTIDNPFDPFEDFKEWWQFDTEQGYGTCQYLARVANVTNEMSDIEKKRATNAAIDQIIENDPINIFKRVEFTPKQSPSH